MKNLFSYDNKVMQMLMTLGDLIILNFIFLLCCIPIVTVGAAQAGLYTAIRVLMDKEDDSSCVAAFFRGLRSGFGRITAAYTVMLVIIAVSLYALVAVSLLHNAGMKGAPVIISTVALLICAIFQTLICLFHSRFGCTFGQLFRNAWFLFLMHPLRALGATLLTWLPLLLALYDFYFFIALGPLWLSFAFSFLFMLAYSVMRKPLDEVLALYNERNGIVPEPPASEAETPEEDGQYSDTGF